MKNPTVSIVTPSFNQGAYLEATILSVLQQDYHPIEYILIDGASTDNSLEIINKYANKISYWRSEADNGQAEAINKGFHHADGEILAWLNSDDLYLPGAIRQAVNIFNQHPEIGLVYGDALSIDSQGYPINWLSFRQWGLLDLMSFRMICQPAVFFRREAWEKAGQLDESLHYMLDHHLWIRIALHSSLLYAGAQTNHSLQSSKDNLDRMGIPNYLWAGARHHPDAKNVSQASGFHDEIFKLVAWFKENKALAPLFQQNRKKILGGAYRLSGRYLLDGGFTLPALQSYLQAFAFDPAYAARHSHRIIFALTKLIRSEAALQKIQKKRESRIQTQLINQLEVIRFPINIQTLGSRVENVPSNQ